MWGAQGREGPPPPFPDPPHANTPNKSQNTTHPNSMGAKPPKKGKLALGVLLGSGAIPIKAHSLRCKEDCKIKIK